MGCIATAVCIHIPNFSVPPPFHHYYHGPSAAALNILCLFFYSSLSISLGHALGRWITDVLNCISSPHSAEVLFAALSHNVPDDDASILRIIMKEVMR